jgi:hypothetical protein
MRLILAKPGVYRNARLGRRLTLLQLLVQQLLNVFKYQLPKPITGIFWYCFLCAFTLKIVKIYNISLFCIEAGTGKA